MRKLSALTRKSLYSLVFGFLVVSVFLLTFSVNVKAADETSYFPMYQNGNNRWTNGFITALHSKVNPDTYYYVAKLDYNQSANRNEIAVIYWKKDAVITMDGTIAANGYNWSLQKHGSGTYYYASWYFSGSNTSINQYFTNTNNGIANMQGYPSSFKDTKKSYISNTNIMVAGSDRDAILWYQIPVFMPTEGHAQDPMNNLPTIQYPIGMHPSAAPTVPTYTVPSTSNAPSYDNDHPFQSLFDILVYWLGFIADLILGIIQNIIDWATFFGNFIAWLFKSYIDWLNTFTDWLYNIFKYLFEPFYNFLSAFFSFLFSEDDQLSIYDLLKQLKNDLSTYYSGLFSDTFFTDFWDNFTDKITDVIDSFANVILFATKFKELGTVNNEFSISNLLQALFIPSSNDVAVALHSHDEFGFHDCSHAVRTASNNIYSSLSNLTPVKSFHIPGVTWHGVVVGNFDLDFSWYDNFKTYGDGIITVFLTISWVYWVILNLSNWLRGSASVGSDVSRLEK